MSPLAVILVLISALMHASRNFFTKKSEDKSVFVWWYEIIALILFLPLFIYYILKEGMPADAYFFIAVVAGFFHFLYWLFLSKSYRGGDLSHVYPIMRSSPAFVLVFSIIFFNEKVSLPGVFGIILIAVGVYIINMKAITLKNLLTPVQEVFREKHTRFAFLTLLSVTAYTLADKVGVDNTSPVLHVYFYTIFGMIFFSTYIFRVRSKKNILKEWVQNKRDIIISGCIGITGYTLILIAFTLDKVSYITGLRQLSIVFAVLMGGHILKEKYKLIRISASVLIFIGAFLITIA